MAIHFIAVGSSFAKEKRYAWHYATSSDVDMEIISAFKEQAAKYDLKQYSFHTLTTENFKRRKSMCWFPSFNLIGTCSIILFKTL